MPAWVGEGKRMRAAAASTPNGLTMLRMTYGARLPPTTPLSGPGEAVPLGPYPSSRDRAWTLVRRPRAALVAGPSFTHTQVLNLDLAECHLPLPTGDPLCATPSKTYNLSLPWDRVQFSSSWAALSGRAGAVSDTRAVEP